MASESGVVVQGKGEEERTECKDCIGISLLSFVEKAYAGILIESVE